MCCTDNSLTALDSPGYPKQQQGVPGVDPKIANKEIIERKLREHIEARILAKERKLPKDVDMHYLMDFAKPKTR